MVLQQASVHCLIATTTHHLCKPYNEHCHGKKAVGNILRIKQALYLSSEINVMGMGIELLREFENCSVTLKVELINNFPDMNDLYLRKQYLYCV